jgi:hypothetical protein
MHDVDAIEAINFDQLATATDRLLLRSGHVAKRRPTRPSMPSLGRGTQPGIPVAPTRPTVQRPPAPRGSNANLERTVIIRPATASRVQVFAITVVIPTLLGITVGLAALL